MMDPVTQPFDALVLFTMGLTISLGHCVGMCGPLVAAFAVSRKQSNPSVLGMGAHALTYHVGRITSYSILGAIMGFAGATFLAGETGRQIEGGLSLLVALIMLLLGLTLAGSIPGLAWLENLPWKDKVTCHLQAALAAPSPSRSYGMGFANGWLPCGPVFAAAMTSAATGSIWKGALAMVFFGLGTLPLMVLLTTGAARLGPRLRRTMNRVGAVLIVLVALQLGLRGLAAWNVVAHLRFGEVVIW